MALPIWQRTITTESGDIIPGAEVEVVNEATGLAADIFSNRAGTTPRTNPFFTGSDGFAQFYAAPGEYRITATGSTGSITWRWNVLAGDAALRTTGTGAAQVPTNGDLGSAAFVDTGTAAGEVPTNNDLGTISTQDANSVNISGGAISSTNVTGGTVNATTLQQGGSQAYVRSNILGTVSQSGGVPTGAVIESGSNANGEFVKYADGTMICTKTVPFTTSINIAFGNVFISNSVILGAFAATFSVVPHAISTTHLSPDGRAAWLMTNNLASTTSFNNETFFVRGTSEANFSRIIKAMAIGRWF